MSTNNAGDWRELFDVALFEPSRIKSRQRIQHARNAINNRLNALMKDTTENGRSISEHIALRDALNTLAELYKIVCARKPRSNVSGAGHRAAG